MNRKFGVIILLAALIIAVGVCIKLYNVKKESAKQEPAQIVTDFQVNHQENVQPQIKPSGDKTVKINLYKSTSENALSLNSIKELSNLPAGVQNFASEILDNSNNIYLIKKVGNDVIVVYDNPQNYRHGIDVTKISLDNGEFSTILFTENSNDEQDEWEYEEEENFEKHPVKHVKYNQNGEIMYTEIWNNNPNAEIKYEKTDAQGQPISINKEIIDENGNMRQEHLIYDKEGNTEINISTSFEGAKLVRFTYYDSKSPENGTYVFNEYAKSGEKTKETVYTSDLKLQNIYIPEFKNGERSSITVLDNENRVINKLAE